MLTYKNKPSIKMICTMKKNFNVFWAKIKYNWKIWKIRKNRNKLIQTKNKLDKYIQNIAENKKEICYLLKHLYKEHSKLTATFNKII